MFLATLGQGLRCSYKKEVIAESVTYKRRNSSGSHPRDQGDTAIVDRTLSDSILKYLRKLKIVDTVAAGGICLPP